LYQDLCNKDDKELIEKTAQCFAPRGILINEDKVNGDEKFMKFFNFIRKCFLENKTFSYVKNNTKKLKFKIVTPSANNVDEKEKENLVRNAEKFLNNCGLKYEYGELFDKKDSYLSGTPKQRSKELMDAFLDKETDFIISSQGGNNSNDLLSYLDYNVISQNDKPFFGLSDITVLLNVIAVKSKIITYHGIDYLWGLGKNATNYTKEIIEFLPNNKKPTLIKNPNTKRWESIQEGKGEGIILGGCLPSFCLLLGTEYDPIEELNKDFILVLEDIGQSKSEINSMLTQLKQHKKFNLCKGIIFGSFFFCKQEPKCNDDLIEDVVKRVFLESNIPLARIS